MQINELQTQGKIGEVS